MTLRWMCALLLAAQFLSAETTPEPALMGFTSQSSPAQVEVEKTFRDGIVANNIRENMRRMSARPHHVGSAYDKDNAEWILARFKEWGFDAKIETFQVLFPTPKERVVELVVPSRFRAKLQEPIIPQDPTTNQISEQLP